MFANVEMKYLRGDTDNFIISRGVPRLPDSPCAPIVREGGKRWDMRGMHEMSHLGIETEPASK